MSQILMRIREKGHDLLIFLTRSTTAAFVIFLLVGLTTVYLVQQDNIEQAKKAALVGCDRDNEFRRQVNERGVVTRRFMIDAAISREKQAEIARKKGRLHEAQVNADTAAGYRLQAKAFKDLPYIDCEASYEAQHTIYEELEPLPTRPNKSPVQPKTSTQPTAKGADS